MGRAEDLQTQQAELAAVLGDKTRSAEQLARAKERLATIRAELAALTPQVEDTRAAPAPERAARKRASRKKT
jgi:hypothetical protein